MVTAQYQAALHSYAEGRYEEAMQQFSELLYEDPRNPKLHIWLGATFRKAGKIEYAKVQYQQVLSLTNDPDLLDLASTSLAQIQNQLASANRRSENKLAQPDLNPKDQIVIQSSDQLITSNPISADGGSTRPDFSNISVNSNVNSNVGNGNIAKNNKPRLGSKPRPKSGIEINQILTDSDSTLFANVNGANVNGANIASEKSSANGKMNVTNGAVPPPPAIAALLKSPQPQETQETRVHWDEKTQSFVDSSMFVDSGITEESQSSKLAETIATIERTSKQGEKEDHAIKNSHDLSQDSKKVFSSSSLERVFGNQDKSPVKSPKPIALEDLFKFSSLGQKIILWGSLVATVPAIALGIAAYQVGDGLLLSQVKQGQQSQAIALAKTTESFLKQQVNDVGVLKKLLISTDAGQTLVADSKGAKSLASLPIAQQRQYKQQLTNRLNLYSQAYPQYTSIALFGSSGELIAQSSNSKILQALNPIVLGKTDSADNVLLTNPIVGKDGAAFYAVTLVKSPASFQGTKPVGMFLQVEIPVKTLTTELSGNGLTNIANSDFYVIDSSNKYITSSQTVTVGDDATANFAMLPDLRSSQSNNLSVNNLTEVTRGDRHVEILAYATVPNMQSYGILPWDVLTAIDKTKAIAGNQNLLLVIGIGLGATPLLAAAIAFGLSRNLSTRLKNIRLALQDLKVGNADRSSGNAFKKLSTKGNDELSEISSSINKMSGQFQIMMQKQEQEQQRLQMQVVKLFKVLSKLAREEKQEIEDADLSDENILLLGKKVRAEMVQRNAEVQSYRQQKEELQGQLMQMLRDVQALADGDLTVSTKAVDGNLVDVAIFFDDVMRGLQNVVSQVRSSANQVNFSLGQNEQAIANLTSVSQRQIDTVTRSLNTAQMSKISATTIANHSQQVIQSSLMVAEKLSDGDRSIDAVMEKVGELQHTVSTTAKRVKHLGEVSQKISKAISSINEIAIKTNFLAINATLEASRTGATGSGFVMVAEEVGELASRSVAATKEIGNLLSNIQNETNAVMAAVESGSNQVSESSTLAIAAKDSLQQIAQISQQIDGLMSSIVDATTSQVQTSEGVANLMQDISHIAKKTLSTSSEVSKSMKATKQYSGNLQQSLAHFKTR